MALRDQMAEDFGAILSDSDEFGGTVEVAGQPIPGFINDDTVSAPMRASEGRTAQGVYQTERVLSCWLANEDRGLVGLARRPVEGERLNVAGDIYFVLTSRLDFDLLTIRLRAWEG